MSVRRATASDAVALAELVNRAYLVEVSFVDGDRTNPAEIITMMGTGTFLVIEHAGGLAAAVYMTTGMSTGMTQRRGYLGMLSVLPEAQGHGLGTRLVRIAEALCMAAGMSTMSLRIVSVREELGRWYRSLGYREVGTTPYTHRPVKRPCHFVEMERTLHDVETTLAA